MHRLPRAGRAGGTSRRDQHWWQPPPATGDVDARRLVASIVTGLNPASAGRWRRKVLRLDAEVDCARPRLSGLAPQAAIVMTKITVNVRATRPFTIPFGFAPADTVAVAGPCGQVVERCDLPHSRTPLHLDASGGRR